MICNQMFELQRLVLPALEFGAPEDMYVRVDGDRAIILNELGAIKFVQPVTAHFDTFFNGFSAGRWKENCDIPNLHFAIEGIGAFVLRFFLHRFGHTSRLLHEREVKLKKGLEQIFELPFWNNIQDGILYFSVTALTPGEIHQTKYLTSEKPKHQVKLGIVITHFNRKHYVLPAIRRLKAGLFAESFFKDKISLVVVDNSQNITPEEAEDVALIPNRNLGGSGGFMRGLLHLEDEGIFTHCLFMDDDASCEIESIRRTFAILSYGKLPRLAVAGCILRDVEPWRLEDKQFVFDGHCRPIKSGLDMRKPSDLIWAEVHHVNSNFGGWWHFAFSLADVKHYAFPFFVKGDDITFGMMNRFNICTMNGIGSWAEEFTLKSNRFSHYLDARALAMMRSALLDWSAYKICRELMIHCMGPLYTYNYSSAAAVSLALAHFSKGKDFWEDNLDLIDVRSELNKEADVEKMVKIDRRDFTLAYAHQRGETRLLRNFMEYSMGGHLLPDFLLEKKKHMHQPKGFHGQAAQTFGFKRILYEYEPLGLGYVASIDRRKFFKSYFLFMRRALKFLVRAKPIQKEQKLALFEFTQRKFWEKVYRSA